MWVPFDALSTKVLEYVIKCFDNEKFQTELSRRIRLESETQRNRTGGQYLNYDSLTQGNVNLQARMAASGYQTYGNVVMKSNNPKNLDNVYKNMKNKLHFAAPTGASENRGSYRKA